MAKLIGRAVIKMNGKEIKTLPGAKLNPGGKKRTMHAGSNEVLGHSEELVIPFISGEYVVGKDTPVQEINDAENVVVLFISDIGRTWTLTGAVLEEPGDITAKEGGSVPFKFFGMACEEMK